MTPLPHDIVEGAVRVVLIAGGVADRHIDWMVASCPSIRHAIAFVLDEERRRLG